MSAPEGFETWLHQLNDAFVASTTASLDVEEALMIVKRRAATTDLTHGGGPDLVLQPAAHCGTEQPLDSVPLEKKGPRSTIIARKHWISLKTALFVGAFVLTGCSALSFSVGKSLRMTPAADLPDVNYFGITARPKIDTSDSKKIAGFTFTASARGSVSHPYTLQLDNPSQPGRGDTIIFNGPPQIRHVDYQVASRSNEQFSPEGVTVVVTLPGSSRPTVFHGECHITCLTRQQKGNQDAAR